MSQLQQDRHTRVAPWTRRRANALQRVRPALRQTGEKETNRRQEHTPQAVG